MFANFQTWQRFLTVVGSIILMIAALWVARDVVIPVVLALLLCFVLSPAVAFLQRRGLSRIPAVLLVVTLALIPVCGLGLTLIVQTANLAGDLPKYKESIAQKIIHFRQASEESFVKELFDAWDEIQERIKEPGAEPKEGTEPKKANGPAAEPVAVRVTQSPLPLFQAAASSFLDFLVQVGLVLLLLVFMLVQREDLRNRVLRLWGNGNITTMTKAFDEAGVRLSKFLQMQLIINGTYGLVLFVGLAILGIPYAFVAGLLAAALRYIPYLGPWLAAAFPVVVAVAVFPGWGPVLWVIGLIVVLELVSNNLMEPVLYGNTIGVSETALLIAAAFWTWLWGPLGLVVATPLTACLAVFGKYVPQLEFLDVLLGRQQALDSNVIFFQRLLARDQDEATDLVEEFLEEHPGTNVWDRIVAPALLQTVRARNRGEITEADASYILEAAQEVIDQAPLPAPDHATAAPPQERVLLFGVPARDEADALILRMLKRTLPTHACRMKIASPTHLTTEVLTAMEKDRPAALCIGLLSPGRMAHTRYLCRKLRGQFPNLKIMVLCIGADSSRDKVTARLLAAGAEVVTHAVEEAHDWLLSHLSILPKTPEPAAVSSARLEKKPLLARQPGAGEVANGFPSS